MPQPQHLREHSFSGSPESIGLAHGESLREKIWGVYEVYKGLWGFADADIPTKVVQFKLAVKRFLPHLAQEIEAIATGAGLDEDAVHAINARTELFVMSEPELPGLEGSLAGRVTECTAVGIAARAKVGNDVVLGQNWDWYNTFRGLTEVVSIRPVKGPAMQMLIEPGMVGKIGMNDAGVGVCLNYLATRRFFPQGLPVHVLLRALLECTSYQRAYDRLVHFPRAASANYLVGDTRSKIGNFEATPWKMHCIPVDRFVTHTNSYNGDGELCLRQQRFESALRYCMFGDEEGRISPDSLNEALQKTGVQFPAAGPGGIETIHTIIMNLTQGRLLVSDGARSSVFRCYGWEGPATSHSLKSAGPA